MSKRAADEVTPERPRMTPPPTEQELKQMLEDSRRAVQPMVDREAEAEHWPCICNHDFSWHRYDCPRFNLKDYGVNISAATSGVSAQDVTPDFEKLVDELMLACLREYAPAKKTARRALLSAIDALAKNRADEKAEYHEAMRMYIAENRRLHVELSALRSQLDAMQRVVEAAEVVASMPTNIPSIFTLRDALDTLASIPTTTSTSE